MSGRQVNDQGESAGNRAATPGSTNRSTAEWVTLGVSLAAVLAVVGLVVFLYIRGETRPPTIAVEPSMENIRQGTGGYYLPVDVTNGGDQTVEDVRIEAELVTGSGHPQTLEFSIQYLAGGEHAQGTFVFQDDPRQGELTIGAISYRDP